MKPREIDAWLGAMRMATAAHAVELGRGLLHPLQVKAGIYEAIHNLPAGSKVLEIGAGKGEAINQGRRYFQKLKFFGTNFYDRRNGNYADAVAEASALPFKTNSFDLIYSVHVWQYVPDKARFLEEVHRVLKPGGEAIIHAKHYPEQHNFIVQGHEDKGLDYLKQFPDLEIEEIDHHDKIAKIIRVRKKAKKLEIPAELNQEKSHIHFKEAPNEPHFISVYRQHNTTK